MHLLTQNDHDSTKNCSPGDEIRIHLPYIAGTGYTWEIAQVEGPIQVVTSDIIVLDDEAMGSTSMFELNLRVKAKGLANVHLKHYRSWEGDASIIEEYRIQFIIQ